MVSSSSIPGAELTRIDRDVLGYASCRHLPSQFACHVRSPEAIMASCKKDDVRQRCRELGITTEGSLSQMVMAIAQFLVVRGQPFPLQFVSLNHMVSGSDQFKHAHSDQSPAIGPCWLCGCNLESIGLNNVADFQVGSWPPGDPRRWQFGASCVIPVVVCRGYATAKNGSKEPAARSPHRLSFGSDILETRKSLYREPSHRLTCKVGDFETISAVFWEGRWWSLDDAMTLCTGNLLPDGVMSCPQEPSIERVCLQLLNWFSMSGLDKADKNCLPARVYLTRPARLVSRAGQVVGYMTYTPTANEHFPIPTLCAIYVRPEARGRGACRALFCDFIALARAANNPSGSSGGGGGGVPVQVGGELVAGDGRSAITGGAALADVGGDDCEMYGIEAPVSKALLQALPKMLSHSMLKKFRVIQHGDTIQQVQTRNSLWQDVCKECVP